MSTRDRRIVRERLAELGEEVGRRLDARPVVLVEDEQARRSARGADTRRKANVQRVDDRPLRILFAAPAWWPAAAFGGPDPVTRELDEAARGARPCASRW